VKLKRVLVVSVLGILLASTILGAIALSRISMAYNIARQYAAAVKPPEGDVTSSTNLTAIIYLDPEPARPTLNMFQYVTAQNIQWRTTTTDQMGNLINIDFNLGSVLFQKLSEDNFVGTATGLNVLASVSDLFNIRVKADNVNVDLLFWRYADMPALNVTGVLTGNVEVSLSVAVLPLPGLSLVAYEYKGDRFIIRFCFIKPIEVTMEQPSHGARVSGDVHVQALVKHAPEITVDKRGVICGTPNEQIQMHYNEMNGRWECVWQSYNVGNGRYGIGVRAEGFDQSTPQNRYSDQKGIEVEVNNPWVQSYVLKNGGWLEAFGGLMINGQYGPISWQRGTVFNFWPRIDLSMTAPGGWDYGGPIGFHCWRIDDESGKTIFVSDNPTLTINAEVQGKLFNSEGRARELKCIYVPV